MKRYISMKRLSSFILVIISLIFQSCSNSDHIPDYAAKLEGEFDIGYLIVDLDTKEAVSSKLGVSKHAKINLKRKSNQYLTATVTIDDENITLSENFEIIISPSQDQTESFGKPGFVYKYLAMVNNGSSFWSLYEDGTIVGMVQYDDGNKIRKISIGSDF